MERFKELTTFLLIVLCGLVLVPVITLAWLWKIIVQIIVFIFYKNLHLTFLGVIDTIFYVEEKTNFYLKPKRVMVLSIVLEGQLDLDDVRKRVQKNAIEARGTDGSQPFLRFQQRLFKKFGYAFLGLDKNFNILNHITQTQVSLNQNSMYDFVRNSFNRPLPGPNSPLWEILLVPNYNSEDKTFVLMRFHHSVMDGFSVVNFVKAISDQGLVSLEGLSVPEKNLSKSTTKFERLTNLYKKTIALPRTYFIENASRPTVPSVTASELGYLKVIKEIPLQKFKDFKKRTNVSLTDALVYAASFAMTNGYNLPKDSDTVGCTTTLPLPTTGKTIGNNFTYAAINLPVGSMTLEERVRKCQAEVQKTRNSVSPIVDGLKFMIGTLFPTWIFTKCFPVPNFFVMISNTPGPSVPTSYFGHYPLNLFSAVVVIDSPAINILPTSYNGHLTIFFSGLKQLFQSNEQFEEFVDHYEYGLNTLLSSTNLLSIQPTSKETVEEIVVKQ